MPTPRGPPPSIAEAPGATDPSRGQNQPQATTAPKKAVPPKRTVSLPSMPEQRHTEEQQQHVSRIPTPRNCGAIKQQTEAPKSSPPTEQAPPSPPPMKQDKIEHEPEVAATKAPPEQSFLNQSTVTEPQSDQRDSNKRDLAQLFFELYGVRPSDPGGRVTSVSHLSQSLNFLLVTCSSMCQSHRFRS